MCGLFGYFGRRGTPPLDRCRQLTNLVRHRGPDAAGYWAEGPFFLGHRRLSIIDLSCGAQPMFSGDGRFVLSFNGEIYNYIELRAELITHGHSFRTESDTEVLLAGYREWQTDLAGHLVGMFAFAIADREAQTLYLARDRAGEKPLLYSDVGGALAFASELAPLAALMDGGRRLDLEGLGGYLCLNYVPGERTLMEGVRRLRPGTWQLHGMRGLVKAGTYWRPQDEVQTFDAVPSETLLDDLQTRVDRAVELALRSDVPVGLFLSGGIDSSIVAESAARQGRLKQAYCLDVGGDFSEWPIAQEVAGKIGVPVRQVPFDDAVMDRFVEIVGHADDPLADSSALPVWTVSQAAAQDVKVVLSGDGGDELFGGYLTYAASRLHGQLSQLAPRPLRRLGSRLAPSLPIDDRQKVSRSYKLFRFLRALDLDTSEAHFTWNGTWLPEEAASLLTGNSAASHARNALRHLAVAQGLKAVPTTGELQRADVAEYLANDILVKVDRMTMAHGLESRAPLLNPALLSFALALPDRLKVNRGRTKVLLRALCERHFGRDIAWAKKKGFSIPIHEWLRGRGRSLMTDLLARPAIEAIGVFDAGRVQAAVSDHLERRRPLGWELWGLMVLSAWHQMRIAKPIPSPSEDPEMRAVSPPLPSPAVS